VATRTIKTDNLIDKIIRAGFKPRSYSGRGMFGEECVGVSIQHDSGGNEDELPRGNRVDSLGLGQIWYWPQCKWPAGLEGDDQ
jgi:hypothetical protein